MQSSAKKNLFNFKERVIIWLIGTVLIVSTGSIFYWLELRDKWSQIDEQANIVLQLLTQRLNNNNAVLTSLTGLHQASEGLTSAELTSIAQRFLKEYPYIDTIAYISGISQGERAAFEQTMQQDGFVEFKLFEFDSNSSYKKIAQIRDFYFPISFLEPMEPETAGYLGLDLSMDSDFNTGLKQSIREGQTKIIPSTLITDLPQLFMIKPTYFGHFEPETINEREQQVSGAFILITDTDHLLTDLRSHFPELQIELKFAAKIPGLDEAEFSSATGPKPSLPIELGYAGWELLIPGTPLQLNIFSELHLNEDSLLWGIVAILFMSLIVFTSISAWRNQRIAKLEQKQHQDALFEEKERAEVTLKSIGDAVITTDKNDRIHYMNPMAENLTGWFNGEALGRHLAEVVILQFENNHYPVLSSIEPCLSSLNNTEKLILNRRDQHMIAVDHTISPICDRDENTIGAVLILRDVSNERELTKELAYQANHDLLTGLTNRRAFELNLEKLMRECGRSDHHVLCYLDLDQFKLVNDTCGHTAGDQLLKQVATLLGMQIREVDILARLGGDEFAVLFINCALQQAEEITERLRNTLMNFRFHYNGKEFSVTSSIGIVPININSGSPTDVMSLADLACYAAKEKGRNCIHVYQPGDQTVHERHSEMQWHSRIQKALAEDRFILYWQTIQGLDKTKTPVELREFLVRMLSPEDDIHPPMAFIPAAERYGLMPKIDRWVINRALKIIGSNYKTLPQTLFSINLSGQSFDDSEIADFIIDCLHKYSVPPEIVCFEITETAAVTNLKKAKEFIIRLRKFGCHFALDDFGTGLSSFAYLKHLPVDYLKIDGQFVNEISLDPVNLEMLKSINQIGHILGLNTIAEGIENEQTLALLEEIGIDYAQGYYVAKPESANTIRLEPKLAPKQVRLSQQIAITSNSSRQAVAMA